MDQSAGSFVCWECGIKFERDSLLANHTKKQGCGGYHCPHDICTFNFTSDFELQQHIQNDHFQLCLQTEYMMVKCGKSETSMNEQQAALEKVNSIQCEVLNKAFDKYN